MVDNAVLPPQGTTLSAAQAAAAGLKSYAPGAASDPSGLFAGTGSMAVVPPGMAAGWYQMPGTNQAVYVDPKTGGVPPEVASGQISSKNLITGDPETTFKNDYYQSPAFLNTEQKAIDLEKTGLTPQQAQDKLLGTGPDQKGVLSASGVEQNMDSIYELEGKQNGETAAAEAASQGATYGGQQTGVQPKPGDPGFRDVSPINSTLLPPLPPPPAGLSGYDAYNQPGVKDYLAAKQLRTAQAAAALTKSNQSVGQTLAEQNLAKYGNLEGMSSGATSANTELYNSIQSEDEKQSWLTGQDPANLSPELRAARDTAMSKLNAIYTPGVNDKWSADTLGDISRMTGKTIPGETKGDFSVLYGDISQTDPLTGRTTIYGEHAKDVRYTAPKASDGGFGFMGNLANTGFGEGVARGYGGLVGGMSGFIMSGGNPLAAGLGAYGGAGGWMPSNGFKGGTWKAGKPGAPSGQSLLISGILSGGLGAAKNLYAGLPAFGQGMPVGMPSGGGASFSVQ